MGLAPGRSDSFEHTGTAWPWWPGPADNLNFRSKGTTAWPKVNPYTPQYSTCLWTSSSATEQRWRRQPQTWRDLDRQSRNWRRTAIITMVLLCRTNRRGYRRRSTSSLASSTGSDSGQTQERQSACHTRHATSLDECLQRRTRGRRWGQGQPSGSDRGGAWNAQSVGWRLRWGC